MVATSISSVSHSAKSKEFYLSLQKHRLKISGRIMVVKHSNAFLLLKISQTQVPVISKAIIDNPMAIHRYHLRCLNGSNQREFII
jgi:hypothetical protein